MIKPGSRAGDYLILEELGTGGMGVVFRARQRGTDREVAIKIMKPELVDDELLRERFHREGRVSHGVSHRNLVEIIGAGVLEGMPFIVMELLDGGSLRAVLDRHAPLPPADASRILTELAQGLAHLHQNHIIHRDLKPENVLIAPDGRLKITDFGLAKDTTKTALTRTLELVGTLAFIAPEVVSSQLVSAKADVYALGVIAYWMLTGELPYTGGSLEEWLDAIVTRQPRAPRRIRPDVTELLDQVVMTMLSKAPEDRPEAHEIPLLLSGTRKAVTVSDRLKLPSGKVPKRRRTMLERRVELKRLTRRITNRIAPVVRDHRMLLGALAGGAVVGLLALAAYFLAR